MGSLSRHISFYSELLEVAVCTCVAALHVHVTQPPCLIQDIALCIIILSVVSAVAKLQ